MVFHENRFEFKEFEPQLKRLLEKYGSSNASNTRNEPFWRLKNDGFWDLDAPKELIEQIHTPSANQLLTYQVAGIIKVDLYDELIGNLGLISEIAKVILNKFVSPKLHLPLLAEAAPNIRQINRNYWWVSQNQTYKYEVPGNFMWSPKTNKDGGRNISYEYMTQIQPGDVVFSFAESKIKAIGIVNTAAVSSIKPDFGTSGANWLDDGWFVDVTFEELKVAEFKPSEHMDVIGPTLPDMYSPIRVNGVGNQIYLAKISENMSKSLIELTKGVGQAIINDLDESFNFEIPQDEEEIDNAIKMRTDIGPTQKIQIISSRRGQGVFKANVRLIEKGCRLTKVTAPQHLIASHIKPWSNSDDSEKLSGYNGLLLSPHLDHLFDKGFISFNGNGNLLLSQQLDKSVLDRWSLNPEINVGSFSKQQQGFLEYHRDVVLK